MPDLTSAQTASNIQPQGTPERPTEEKEDDLNPFIALLMLLVGFVLAVILVLPIFMLSMGGGHPIDPILLLFIGLGVSFFPLVLYLSIKLQDNYIIESYFIVGLAVCIIFGGIIIFYYFSKNNTKREYNLQKFENAQKINAYLPTTLQGWTLANNNIDSSGGVVKALYLGSNSSNISIEMTEIVSPKTDLKCSNETLLEINKMVTVEFSISDKRWLTNCEELSISGERAILSEYDGQNRYGYDDRTNPPTKIGTYQDKEFLMVFDKGNTRIYLDYEQVLENDLINAKNSSKSDLIRLVENLRPINSKDFGL